MSDWSIVFRQPLKSVLAVGAHPDDLEILCAGTLAKYVKQGVKVTMAIATDGRGGHMVIPPKELAEIRHREAESSAKIIGADFYWLGDYVDIMLFEDIETRLRFVELIRKVKPELILTHSPEDYHPDHRIVSRLMFDASCVAGQKNVLTESPFHPGVQGLYYFDTLSGVNFRPAEFVNVTDTFETKREMLACHASQVSWLKDHDDVDMFQMMEALIRARGAQCGVIYAEAFRAEPAWSRSSTNRMLP